MLDLSKAELAQRIRVRVHRDAPSTAARALRLPGISERTTSELVASMERRPPTQAAVVVPLVDRPGGYTVLLTRRADHLRDHAGQVSFPGGRMEPEDQGPVAAALREMLEETGVGAEFVEVVGFLDAYMTGTGFAVTPVVCFVREGFTLSIDELEVAEVFEVPLRFVLDPANRTLAYNDALGRRIGFWEMPYEGYRIWGATAGMLKGLHDMLV